MYIVEIEQDKYESLSESVEQALRCMGRVMRCIETLRDSAADSGDDGDETGQTLTGYRTRRGYYDSYERPVSRRTGRYSRY